MLIDVMAHRHADDPKFREELVTDDFEEEVAAFLASRQGQEAEVPVENPDEWETVIDDRYGG
jgi:hypothetical protein